MALHQFVPQDMLTPETRTMLQWFQVYFFTYQESTEVDVDALQSLVRLRSTNATPESLAITLHYCEMLRKPASEAEIRGVLGTLYDLDFAGRAGAVLASYERGEDVDVVHELETLARQAKRAKANGKSTDYIDTSIGELLNSIQNDIGIKFRRLPLLYENVGAIQGGTSIALGARPDKGKTSLVADIITDWAPQCVQFFGMNRPILWLNNEGSGKRIIPRVYQAALGLDLTQIIELSNKGELTECYTKAIQAPQDYIRVKDIHGANLAQIEQVIEDMNPCVVVFDMLANVRVSSREGSNKADAVEGAWQEVREIAVRHNLIALSTVQISVEGGNMLYPPYSAFKDSKTGIQGATDLIITLGSLDNPAYQQIRGLGTPKNKFALAGKQSYATGELHFDAARCRFLSGDSNASPNLPNATAAPLAQMVV